MSDEEAGNDLYAYFVKWVTESDSVKEAIAKLGNELERTAIQSTVDERTAVVCYLRDRSYPMKGTSHETLLIQLKQEIAEGRHRK